VPKPSESVEVDSIEDFEEVEELPNIPDMQVLILEMYFKLG
jgi:hypothetical protein